jgi:Tat protein translocase TatB subunit
MDSFLGIGILELVFIVIFALIFLGPERLPQVLRDVISAIRKVRSFSSEITQHLNEEFGDLAELDPRRQLQQALNEDPKSEKKSAIKKPAAKTAPTTKSPATTKSTTPKTGTSSTGASSAKSSTTPAKSTVEKSSSAAASTSKPESDAALAAASSSAASSATSPNGVENAGTNGSVPNPESSGAVDSAPLAEEPKADTSTPLETDPVARHDVTAGDGHLEGTEPRIEEPRTEQPAEQISPASAYFAEKAKAEKENGIHSHSTVAKHTMPDPEKSVLDTLTTDNPVADNPVAEDPVAEDRVVESASDNHTIAPPELQKQEIREDESVAADLPAETLAESPVDSAAKEDRA